MDDGPGSSIDPSLPDGESIDRLIEHISRRHDDGLVEALNYSEWLLCRESGHSEFDDMFDAMDKNLEIRTCQTSWNKMALFARCRQCAKSKDAVICFGCLARGDHEGHDVTIGRGNEGNCCCGDPSMWKETGFCRAHRGHGGEVENELGRGTVVVLVASVAAVFRDIDFYASFDARSFLLTIKWVHRFLILGDSVRKCVLRGVIKGLDLMNMFRLLLRVDGADCDVVFNVLGSLVSDPEFREFFTRTVIMNFPDIVRNHIRIASLPSAVMQRAPLYCSYKTLLFTSHAFTSQMTKVVVETVNWVRLIRETLDVVGTRCMSCPKLRTIHKCGLLTTLARVTSLLHMGLDNGKPEDVARFLSDFSAFLRRYELRRLTVREFGDRMDDLEEHSASIHFVFYAVLEIVETFAKKRWQSVTPLLELNSLLVKMNNDPGLSILGRNTPFGMMDPLHILAFNCLELDMDKFIETCRRVDDDTDALFRRWALMPLRFHFASEFVGYGFFVRNCGDMQDVLHSVKLCDFVKRRYLVMFRMVQTLLMKSSDRLTFAEMIASTSGVLSMGEDMTSRDRRNVLFVFLHYMTCVIYDRMALHNDEAMMRKLAIMSLLKVKPQPPSEFRKVWSEGLEKEGEMDELMTYAERTESVDGVMFRLINDSDWHPLLSYIRIGDILKLMSAFVCKHPSAVIKFPRLPPELKDLLVSPLMMALYFHVLSDPEIHNESAQLVFNCMIDASCEFPDDEEKCADVVTAVDISELRQQLNGVSFRTFVHTKIAYAERPTISIINILLAMGNLGGSVISRMRLTKGCVARTQSDNLAETKSRAKAMRDQIMQQFRHQQNDFMSGGFDDVDTAEENVEECGICHCIDSDKVIGYPALVFQSVIPFLAEHQHNGTTPSRRIYEKTFLVEMCRHVVHPACDVQSAGRRCPVDRVVRNTWLPRIPSGFGPIENEAVMTAVNDFLSLFKGVTSIAELSRVYSGQIEMLELRHRSNPGCLSEDGLTDLLHNYFLCLWSRKEEAEYILDVDSNALPPFVTLILLLLASGIPHEKFDCMVRVIAGPLNSRDKYAFLRRALIFKQFGIGLSIIACKSDWDTALEYDALCVRFSVANKQLDGDLKPFGFIELPESFLGFMNAPFGIDLANNEDLEIAICLISGRAFVIPSTKVRCVNMRTLIDVLIDPLNNTYSFFLILTGPNASMVVVSSQEFSLDTRTRSCYVDRWGNEDRGLQMHRLPTLSRDRLDWLTDYLLSGKWVRVQRRD